MQFTLGVTCQQICHKSIYQVNRNQGFSLIPVDTVHQLVFLSKCLFSSVEEIIILL